MAPIRRPADTRSVPSVSVPQQASSPLSLLPKELRLAIYRPLLVELTGTVEIANQKCEIGGATAHRYVGDRDLRIFKTTRQIREEARWVFYHENVFTIFLHPTDHRLQPRRRRYDNFYVDLSCVRKCHILSPPGNLPRSRYDSKEQMSIWLHLQRVAETLSSRRGHCKQYLLIECFHFEIAEPDGQGSVMSLKYMAEDLEMVRGVKQIYVRALEPSLWPYLRILERMMMSDHSTVSRHEESNPFASSQSILSHDKSVSSSGRIETYDERQRRLNEIFRRLQVEPLYRDANFAHGLN